ncbi:MAG: YitT family protein [Bacteroidales bacterium]|nr:YitT family protein [Bacteroidales bacterium]
MSYIYKEKPFSKKWFISYSLIIIGAFILSSGFVFFITPYHIVPGGVYGISIIIHKFFNTPIGAIALCFDIPLTIIGFLILGPRFGAKTIVGFTLTALFVDGLTMMYDNFNGPELDGFAPLITDDALLSSIFGGVIIGLGLGLIFKSKATSGGTDIISMIVSKYTKIPLGQSIMIVDSCVVLGGLIAFDDWKIPFYSLIVIFITGKVVDLVMQGGNYDKTLFIVSQESTKIRDYIINDLNRGGTLLKGQGMFNYDDKNVIFTTVSRREMAMLQSYIHEVDPKAFMTVVDANEVLGEGFKSLKDKVLS